MMALVADDHAGGTATRYMANDAIAAAISAAAGYGAVGFLKTGRRRRCRRGEAGGQVRWVVRTVILNRVSKFRSV